LEKITSPEGHDGFLLEFDQVNRHILGFMRDVIPEIMEVEGVIVEEELKATKSSLFGEAEVEVYTFERMLTVGYYFLVALRDTGLFN
jgi:homoserine O-acetyltransferase